MAHRRRGWVRLPFSLDVGDISVQEALDDLAARDTPVDGAVHVRVAGHRIVARRWVPGYLATGHGVLRATIASRSGGGITIRGMVSPSGLDLTIVAILGVAALGLLVAGMASGTSIAMLIAAAPGVLCVFYARDIPRSVTETRRVLERTVRELLDRSSR